ncbi:MAG: type II secretion system protein M [Legionellales bacterium]|nr:type II secretion system protein M [Legionellales bacterium]
MMQPWWDSLAEREKRLVLIGGLVVGIFLFCMLVVAPIHHALTSMRTTVAQDKELLLWMDSASQQIKQLQGAGINAKPVNAQMLLTTVDQSARSGPISHNVTSLTQNSNNTVDVKFNSVDFDGLTEWLVNLRERYGIQAKQISVARVNDRGSVQASVTLETGG